MTFYFYSITDPSTEELDATLNNPVPDSDLSSAVLLKTTYTAPYGKYYLKDTAEDTTYGDSLTVENLELNAPHGYKLLTHDGFAWFELKEGSLSGTSFYQPFSKNYSVSGAVDCSAYCFYIKDDDSKLATFGTIKNMFSTFKSSFDKVLYDIKSTILKPFDFVTNNDREDCGLLTAKNIVEDNIYDAMPRPKYLDVALCRPSASSNNTHGFLGVLKDDIKDLVNTCIQDAFTGDVLYETAPDAGENIEIGLEGVDITQYSHLEITLIDSFASNSNVIRRSVALVAFDLRDIAWKNTGSLYLNKSVLFDHSLQKHDSIMICNCALVYFYTIKEAFISIGGDYPAVILDYSTSTPSITRVDAAENVHCVRVVGYPLLQTVE